MAGLKITAPARHMPNLCEPNDAGFKLTGGAHRHRAPTLTGLGARRLWRLLSPDGCRSGSGLFADWPQCPLAWRYRVPLPTGLSAHWPEDPGPLPDTTVPGFTHGVSLGLDALRRKSTRPLWDTWLEVTRIRPPPAAPGMGRRPDIRVTRIMGRAHFADWPQCSLAWWRPLWSGKR